MMKKVDKANQVSDLADGWFTLFYEGFNEGTGRWCSEEMMGDGILSATIPSGILSGEYLIRSEIVAMHAVGQPQFYIQCHQFSIQSSGSELPTNTFSLPNAIQFSKDYSIYNNENGESFPRYVPETYQGVAVFQTVGPQTSPSLVSRARLRCTPLPLHRRSKL